MPYLNDFIIQGGGIDFRVNLIQSSLEIDFIIHVSMLLIDELY